MTKIIGLALYIGCCFFFPVFIAIPVAVYAYALMKGE